MRKKNTPSQLANNPATAAFTQFPFSASKAISLYVPEPSLMSISFYLVSYSCCIYVVHLTEKSHPFEDSSFFLYTCLLDIPHLFNSYKFIQRHIHKRLILWIITESIRFFTVNDLFCNIFYRNSFAFKICAAS